MGTMTIDIFMLLYSIKYSETWFYYVVFSIMLYYFAATIFQRNFAAFKTMYGAHRHSSANQHTMAVSLPDTLEEKEIPVTSVTSADEFRYKGELFRLRDRMEQLMKEEKLYQEPELTLGDLAKKLQTNSSVLSRVINQCFMLNFNDYINKYRVEDVIAKMSNPKFSNQTLLSIAFDAGFNSKSTFNRAFLKFKETTPRYYYQSLNIEKQP
jgi:AraC-like DNA-binding protein